MNAAEHYRAAERLLVVSVDRDMPAAQVHATLALVGAMLLIDNKQDRRSNTYDNLLKAVVEVTL